MKIRPVYACLVAACIGCSAPRTAHRDAEMEARLKDVRSGAVAGQCDKGVRDRHVAALEWLDANAVRTGGPAAGIGRLLPLALAVKPDPRTEGCDIYKFPLAPPAGNHTLSDEPRAEYDHYFIRVDRRTGTVAGKGFKKFKW